jgi:hypothetical protein
LRKSRRSNSFFFMMPLPPPGCEPGDLAFACEHAAFAAPRQGCDLADQILHADKAGPFVRRTRSRSETAAWPAPQAK